MSEEGLVVVSPEKEVAFLRPRKVPRSVMELLFDKIDKYGYIILEEVLRDESFFEMKLREKYGSSGASTPAPSSSLSSTSQPVQPTQPVQPSAQLTTEGEESQTERIYEFVFERLSKEGRVYEDDVLRHVYGKDSQELRGDEIRRFRRLFDVGVKKRLEEALGEDVERTWDERGRTIYVLGKEHSPPPKITKSEVVEEVALSLASKSDTFMLKDLVEKCVEEFKRRGLPVSPVEDDTIRKIWSDRVKERIEKRLGALLKEERLKGHYKVYRVVRGNEGDRGMKNGLTGEAQLVAGPVTASH
jgi:hypothetical protein